MLRNASRDLLGVVAACVSDKINRVTKQMGRKQGGLLLITKQRQTQIQLCYRLHNRFLKGDYRASESEEGSIKDLCQWLVSQHREMHGTKDEILELGSLLQEQELPQGTYEQVFRAVIQA